MTPAASNGHADSEGNGKKMNGIASLIARPNILALEPYRCARDDYEEGILLDANENAYGPPVETNKALERYPDPYQVELKKLWCQYRNSLLSTEIKPENVFVGVGSDEAIDLLMRIFCVSQKDTILTTPPTYGMYKVCAKVNDVSNQQVPLTPDFDLDLDQVLKAIEANPPKLLFVCSPGNPTCKAIPLEHMKQLSEALGNRGLLVVDEAYVDFSVEEKGSAISLVTPDHPNVVVLQTMSKAFGLAAIRCGFAIAAPDVIQLMNNVKAPYNVNELTSNVAMEALGSTSKDVLKKKLDSILTERNKLMETMAALPQVVKVYPSDSNFILVRFTDHAQELYRRMAEDEAVVTRYRGDQKHCDQCLRITIGTPEENQALLKALDKTWNKIVAATSQK